MAKCPPGVICFENFTLIFIIFSLIIIIYFIYMKQSSYKIEMNQTTESINPPNNPGNNYGGSIFGLFPRPSYSFSNVRE